MSAADVAPPVAPPRHIVPLLAAFASLVILTTDVYLPVLPRVSADLHTSDAAASATVSCVLVGIAVGQVVIGPLSDAVGRRAPLLLGSAAYALLHVLSALSTSIVMLLAVRVLAGFATAACIVVGRAVVVDLFPGAGTTRAFAVLGAVTSIVPVLAPGGRQPAGAGHGVARDVPRARRPRRAAHRDRLAGAAGVAAAGAPYAAAPRCGPARARRGAAAPHLPRVRRRDRCRRRRAVRLHRRVVVRAPGQLRAVPAAVRPGVRAQLGGDLPGQQPRRPALRPGAAGSAARERARRSCWSASPSSRWGWRCTCWPSSASGCS